MSTPPPPVKATLDLTITGMTLNMDGGPVSGGTPSIYHYIGNAFYYHVTDHVTDSGSADGVDIAIDVNAPNSDATTIELPAPVNSVNIAYAYAPVPNPQEAMAFDNPGVKFNGNPLKLSLQWGTTASDVTLMITEQSVNLRAGNTSDTDAAVQLYMVDAEYSRSGLKEGYFVDVPFADNYADCTTAQVNWNGSGGLAGPVGGATSP